MPVGLPGDASVNSASLISCFNTLYLFCKVKSALLIPHANTIQPYLDIRCSVSTLPCGTWGHRGTGVVPGGRGDGTETGDRGAGQGQRLLYNVKKKLSQ